MKKSLGLVELKSTPIGILVVDEMLKSANIEIILANPICPGKYVIIINGQVSDVKSAVENGERIGGTYIIESHIINNVCEEIIPAISGVLHCDTVECIGVIETMSALSIIKLGDIAVKTSPVKLLDIRLARGLGGKGILIISGEISAVKSAIESCLHYLEKTGGLVSSACIPSPNSQTIDALFK